MRRARAGRRFAPDDIDAVWRLAARHTERLRCALFLSIKLNPTPSAAHSAPRAARARDRDLFPPVGAHIGQPRSVSDGGAQAEDGGVLDGGPVRIARVRDVSAGPKHILDVGLNRPARDDLRLICDLDQGFAGPNRQSPSGVVEFAGLGVDRGRSGKKAGGLEIARLRRERFGPSAERSARLEQLELSLEDLEETAAAADAVKAADAGETTEVRGFPRRKPARRPLPEHLPRTRVVYPGPTACPCCGGGVRKLGEVVTESLERVPARWFVVQHVREKVSCRSCEAITEAPAPFHPIARGRAGPNLLAEVVFAKYGLHLP